VEIDPADLNAIGIVHYHSPAGEGVDFLFTATERNRRLRPSVAAGSSSKVERGMVRGEGPWQDEREKTGKIEDRIAAAKVSQGMPPEHAALAVLILLCVLGFGTLLVGCTAGDREGSNAPDLTRSVQAPRSPTTGSTEEASTAKPPPNVAEAAAAGIDESSIRTHLSHLTGVSPAPLERGAVKITERGSEKGRRVAAEYMEETFEEMGIAARIIEFYSGNVRGFNVEATLKGNGGDKHLWVTAHLDSVSVPGANDNASGLVGILLTARALKQLQPEHTIHFVAYDLEEVGYIGSSRYIESVVSAVREREGERAIIGNLNSDMIGYEPDVFDALVGTCDQAGPIDDALHLASKEIGSPIYLYEICLGRSDHQRFWDAGLPAAVLVEGVGYDGYPWYHQPDDTVDKLNIAYLRSMIRLNAASAALLAAPENRS
jgi:Peptidase family M28